MLINKLSTDHPWLAVSQDIARLAARCTPASLPDHHNWRHTASCACMGCTYYGVHTLCGTPRVVCGTCCATQWRPGVQPYGGALRWSGVPYVQAGILFIRTPYVHMCGADLQYCVASCAHNTPHQHKLQSCSLCHPIAHIFQHLDLPLQHIKKQLHTTESNNHNSIFVWMQLGLLHIRE